MNRFLLAFLLACSTVTYSNWKWVGVYKHKTTDQRIALISDFHFPGAHPQEYAVEDQTDALIRIIKPLPRETTGILLESPHQSSSEGVKNFIRSESAWQTLGSLAQKLDQEGIQYEGLDICNDLDVPSTLHAVDRPDALKAFGNFMNCHDAVELYEQNIGAAAKFFRCAKNNKHLSEIERYACSVLTLTQQQYAPAFQAIKSYPHASEKSKFNTLSESNWDKASTVEFDIIALQRIAENPDKKVIFVVAGMQHCWGIAKALEQKMEYTLEQEPLQDLTDNPTTFWPWGDDYYEKFMGIQPIDQGFHKNEGMFNRAVLRSPGVNPTVMTRYLQSFPFSAPQRPSNKDGAPSYPHAPQPGLQGQKASLSYIPCIAATCLGVLTKRRTFGRWWK